MAVDNTDAYLQKGPVGKKPLRPILYKERVNVVWAGGTMVPRSVDTGIFTYKAGEIASFPELDDPSFKKVKTIRGLGEDRDPIAFIHEAKEESEKPNRGPEMPAAAEGPDRSVHHVCGITPYYMIAEGDPDPVSQANFDAYRKEVRDWITVALGDAEFNKIDEGTSTADPRIALIDTGYTFDAGKDMTSVSLPEDEEYGNDDEVENRLVPKVLGAPPVDKESDPLGLLERAAGHGAFVVSTIGHVWENANLSILRAKSDLDGVVDEATVCEQIIEAAKADVSIINLSLGCYAASDNTPLLFEKTLKHVLTEKPDLVIVAAAGNDGSNRKFFPAALSQQGDEFKRLISVGALDGAQKAPFSNRGLWVDWYAPGTDVISKYLGSRKNVVLRTNVGDGLQVPYIGFAQWSGTSYAAPYLSALIARVMVEKKLSAPQAWECLTKLPPTLRRRLRLLASNEV